MLNEVEVCILPASTSTFALKVAGHSMEPVFREGDVLILSSAEAPRNGDRVALGMDGGQVISGVFFRLTEKTVELQPLVPGSSPRLLDVSQVDWIARILWVNHAGAHGHVPHTPQGRSSPVPKSVPH